MSLAARVEDDDDRPCCTSCGGARNVNWTCAVCIKNLCDDCTHEDGNGEVVCPEHAP
ncbi:MAG TPA: hypothetical protein VLI71_00220 [Gammaproteobacteria bacterium]|nr:hypothetical protein [Gammaproteobacteria bacterium]